MTINSSSIPVGATFAPTGGTATTLKTKSANDSRHVAYLDDGATLSGQTTFEFSQKQPKVSVGAPNGYTQARNSTLIKQPFTLDNGNLTVNTIKIEVSCDVELTAAEKLTLRELAAHTLTDSDYTEFWDEQSMA